MVDDGGRGLGWPLLVDAAVNGAEERAFALPTGTVTFLLTDVEGSTRLWQVASEAMTVAIPHHYALLDEAIVSHGGVRPIEQGEGDSVVGAFSRASDAVAAAVAAQLAFAATSWPEGAELRVRMAVHTGEAQLRDGGSYLGHALNRCARIRAAGHGGQVLLSAATAALVTDQLPTEVTLVDLGQHRLKDLGRPERIWQLTHPDLRSAFPALRSLEMFRHNLPLQLTPLIGRVEEIGDVRGLLDDGRLVTLTGSAGVGKTRLALAVAAELLGQYAAGVWWVELAPLADQRAVGRAALAALGAREVRGAPVAAQLAVELGDEPSLVVFDNCEHLVAGCAELIAGLLAASPVTSVLTTSREPLGVSGEITYKVPSLRCPTLDHRLDLPTVSQYDAVALFVERAHRARPSFRVSDANAPAIAQICYRLDGIPLAIELAAARCRQMSAERIATELDDRFRLLTGGSRTVMARQQTLAASVDWSHDRLDIAEQRAFRRVAVFAGPFPLEAAEAVVAAGGDVEPTEVFGLVSQLVDKSLVVADDGPGGETRYRLLESLRAYAADRARVAGELTILRDAHAAWWADWIEPRGDMPTDDVLEQVEEFHANLTAALNWSADLPPVGLRLLQGVGRAWEHLGRAGDAMVAADHLLTDDNAARYTAQCVTAAYSSADLYFSARGPNDYGKHLQWIETVAGQLGDEYHVGLARWREETFDTRAVLRDIARERGDRYVEAWATINLASEFAQNDPVAAAPLLLQADAVAAASGMHSLRDAARFAHAEAAAAQGDLDDTIDIAKDMLESPSSMIWSKAVRALSAAGLLAQNDAALGRAVEAADRALRKSPGLAPWAYTARRRRALLDGQPAMIDPNVRDPNWTWPSSPWTLWLICRETIDAGAPDAAVEHIRLWARPTICGQAVLAAVEAAASGNEDRWQDALAIAVDHRLRLIAVDALEGVAVTAGRAESWTECLRLLAAARRLRDETGYQWRFAFEKGAVDTTRAAALAALADDAHKATIEGGNLDWIDAVSYARRARGQRKRPHHGWTSLTPTEQKVVALVAQGLSNPQIAARLLMGRATVKTHIEHIFTKLGVQSRAALAAEAARRTPQ